MSKLKDLQEWWKTANSSLQLHRVVFVVVAIIWLAATLTNFVSNISFLSHISMAAFLYAIWSCIETAKVEVRQEEVEEAKIETATNSSNGSL